MLGTLLTAVFAFSINGANAVTEAECDVTPGMVWENGACSPLDDVVTTTETRTGPKGTTVQRESYVIYNHGAKDKYNGETVYYGSTDLLIEAQKIFTKKSLYLEEIHGMCADNKVSYGEKGHPNYSATGENCWCRIKINGKTSDWHDGGKADTRRDKDSWKRCAEHCARWCAVDLIEAPSFREAMLTTFN